MTERTVVLGGGYAGTLAALRLSRRGRPVTLVNARPFFCERIRLHQLAAGQDLRALAFARLLRGTGIEFVCGRADAIDLDARRVAVETTDGPQSVPFEHLIYALGSRAAPAPEGTLPVADREGAALLRERIPKAAAHGRRVSVVGAGLTGIEMASELAERWRDLRVSLIGTGALGADLSEAGRAALRASLDRLGVHVIEHARAVRADAGALALADGSELPCDLAIWAGSFAPPPLAREAGLAVGPGGQLEVDAELRSTSHPVVYGAGDAAAPPGTAPIRMSCATAMPQGAHAADNVERELAGREPEPFRFSYALRCVSLGRHDGLIQRVDSHDTPKERVFTRRSAAFIKEQICRYTIRSMSLQRVGVPYFWPRPKAG